MIRKHIFLTEDQINFLSSLQDLSLAEHIRRAVDEYIVKLSSKSATTSPSMKGEQHG